jgi:hypothetical protein
MAVHRNFVHKKRGHMIQMITIQRSGDVNSGLDVNHRRLCCDEDCQLHHFLTYSPAMSDNDLPGGPIRTMSAQRVQIRMNPDGSIIKIPPPSAALQRYAEVDEELDLGPATVAAPIDAPKLDGHDEAIAPTSLQGMPVDVAAVTDTVVMKDDVDHERPHDVAELDGKSLNETKHIMKGVPKEDLWALMRRFDKVSSVIRHFFSRSWFTKASTANRTCSCHRSAQEIARWTS